VREFLPPYHGPQIHPERGAAMQAQRANAMELCKQAIYEHIDEFNRIFGRSYHPYLETYLLEDADLVFYVQGAFAETAKIAINTLREQGVRIGLLRPRWIRPYPEEEILEALRSTKVVGVVETNLSLGSPTNGGSMALDLCTALYHADPRPLQVSFMAGMGGEAIRPDEFLWMADVMGRVQRAGRVDKRTFWAGFDH
jgi:pyruvate ferredoxin oxidoreductase alpha subunit